MIDLVKAELLKIRTTSTWWVFGIILLPLWAISLLVNWAAADLPNQAGQAGDPEKAVNVAAGLYTSGQFFGVMIVMLLGAIVVTNEFFHQTATTTFLTTPRRESVLVAKLIASALLGLVFWLLITVLDLIFAPIVLHHLGGTAMLGEGGVWSAIALNGLAFILWAILGVGFGVLIRSQIAATLVLTIVYVVGTFGAGVLFALLEDKVGQWFQNLQVLVPTTASALMISGADLPGHPARWIGGVVLITYAAIAGVVGTVIMKRRDIA
jgi:ABC-2 type transport system permease protein